MLGSTCLFRRDVGTLQFATVDEAKRTGGDLELFQAAFPQDPMVSLRVLRLRRLLQKLLESLP